MMSPSITRHVHRASVPARPMHRINRRRTMMLPARPEAAVATPKSPNAMLGLFYGVPLSLALWAMIGVAIHIG